MTIREFWFGSAVVCFVAAASVLGIVLYGVMQRARAGNRRAWAGRLRWATPIITLVLLGACVLHFLPQEPGNPNFVNRPAPADPDGIVAFVQPELSADRDTIIAMNARTGQIRWRNQIPFALDPWGQHYNLFNLDSVMRPLPHVILAVGDYTGIYALRASDGSLLWSQPDVRGLSISNRPLPSLIAVDGKQIFIAERNADPPGSSVTIAAFDVSTGHINWRIQAPKTQRYLTALTVADGQVFVAGGEQDSSKPHLVWMSALDEADGSLKWTVSHAIAWLAGISSLFVVGGNVVIVPNIGEVTALRERDGALTWHTPLFAGSNDRIILAATSDGARVYALAEPQLSTHTVATVAEQISPPAALAALDASSGAIRWLLSISPFSDRSTLVVSDGVLLRGVGMVGSDAYDAYKPNGSLLTAYDAATGRALWRDNTPSSGISWNIPLQLAPQGNSGSVYLEGIQADPYVRDNLLCPLIYCPGFSWVYAVNIHTGAPWWRTGTGKLTLEQLGG
ncbi:MAG TPA: PQQ-binding-like beta-propeller repeat protein [Ktedonobacterales bacterium]